MTTLPVTAPTVTPPSTYTDWDPAHVDLLTLPELAAHFTIPQEILRLSIWDDAFPQCRLNTRREMVWRVPDVAEYLDGQRR